MIRSLHPHPAPPRQAAGLIPRWISTPPPTRRHHAFSLIEVLVAITIILLLLGIGVVVMGRMNAAAVGRQTRILLEQLMGIEAELRIQRANVIYDPTTYTTDGPWTTSIPPVPPSANTSIKAFMAEAYKYPNTFDLLAKIDPRLIAGWDDRAKGPDDGNNATINDASNNVLQYRAAQSAPGLAYAGATGQKLPPHPRPFFASPGDDGKFGDYDAYGKALNDAAKDDLFSFSREGSQ